MKKPVKPKKATMKHRKNLTEPLPEHVARYRFKPGFADKVRNRALREYRAERGKDFELSGSTVLRSLDFLEDYAASMTVRDERTGRLCVMRAIRPTVLAKLLDTSYQTVWRWSSETGQIPEPILTEVNQGRERPVYHVEECRIMIRAIGEHLNEFKYYRKDHAGTRDRLFHDIDELRNCNYGEHTDGNLENTGKDSRKSGKARKRRIRK